jgi:tetratricopeptide (TPR) repeat protein
MILIVFESKQVIKMKPNAIFPLTIIVFLLFCAIGFAEVKEIISEGTYNMGDGETPGVAESRALLNAKRAAIEQAGTYVESYSKVKNLQLTEDEIKVMASGLMEVTTVDKKRTVVVDGFHFWVKIKARVNSDKMEEMAGKAKGKSAIEDFKRIQAAYDKSQRDIEELKKQLLLAKGDQKKEIEKKISDDEKRFQANEWIEKGKRATHALSERTEYLKAIEAFTSALALDPTRCDAYGERAIDYQRIGELEKSKEDLDKSLALKCSVEAKGDTYFYAYFAIGKDYFDKKRYYDALEPFNKAERFYDHWGVYRTSDPLYTWRGLAYQRLGQYDRSLKDFEKALAIDPSNGLIFTNMGSSYFGLGNKQQARVYFEKGCNAGNDYACRVLRDHFR